LDEPFDLASLVEEFRDEARDQVDRLDAGILRLERDGRLEESAHRDLLRSLHTLKGNAGMLGLGGIRDFVHVLENVLKGDLAAVSEVLVERLFEGAAVLRRAVESAGLAEEGEAFRELSSARHRLEEMAAGLVAAPAVGGAGVWGVIGGQGGAEAGGEGGEPAGPEVAEERLRVPFAKLDALLNAVGELTAEADALVAAVSTGSRRSARERAELVRRRTDRLRDAVMSLRLVPLGRVLGRFHGLVRRLAQEQGKEARLVLEGEATEVDKSTADALATPLLHLVRNAIDHGIGLPAEREAEGKPGFGTLRISAQHVGEGVRIEVADDGRGLDLERIRDRARAAGLVTGREHVTDEEALELIFRAGFSTRTDVSTVSGRGVGLDVVRRSVRDLRGRLAVEGVEGGGTRFILILPLTVAIVPSLVFEAAGQLLALPASAVARTLRLDRVPGPGAVEVVREGESLLPVVDVGGLFGWAEDRDAGFGILLRQGRDGAALAVDRLLDQRDLVVKAMPRYGRPAIAVTGAAVVPGSRVVLVLDPVAILELSQRRKENGG
jgi:two-component system, chemotaxis family, sensor kinase CheA